MIDEEYGIYTILLVDLPFKDTSSPPDGGRCTWVYIPSTTSILGTIRARIAEIAQYILARFSIFLRDNHVNCAIAFDSCAILCFNCAIDHSRN
jgi:hypothetical protein